MAELLKSHSRVNLRQWPIALLRAYTGVFFAYHGISKLGRGNFTEGMAGFLQSNLESSFAFYVPFIESVVLPNKSVFAALIAWGETAVGIALVLGLATRYAAFAGLVMVANFWFAKGLGVMEGQNHDVVWMMILLVLGLIPAGRIAGLDDGLADRLRFLR
jgi:thiosulfate dehydrogenase [quinone] large subunit